MSTTLAQWMPASQPLEEGGGQEADDPLPMSMLSLLTALRTLARRGSGPEAWAAPLTSDPIAFLLDSTSDAVLVWSAPDRLLYANRAAEELDLRAPAAPGVSRLCDRGHELERRSLRFAIHSATYTVEIIQEIGLLTR